VGVRRRSSEQQAVFNKGDAGSVVATTSLMVGNVFLMGNQGESNIRPRLLGPPVNSAKKRWAISSPQGQFVISL
jgi:hypothetical protein